MTIRDHWDAERNVLFVTFEGELKDEDLLTYARRATRESDVRPGHDELIDLREVTGDVKSLTLRRIAEQFTRHDSTPERSRVALVASGDVVFGLSRMYQAFRAESPLDLRVFREIGEARTWLGIDPD